MKYIILALLISFALATLFYFNLKPFTISPDMAFSNSYSKRNTLSDHDQVFTSLKRYSPQHLEILNSTKEEVLQDFRCSDEFIRTNQGVYILKNIKTSQKYKKTVQNSDFIEFMRNKETTMPQGKKILTVRICETKNEELLLFYSIGAYDSSNVDNSTIIQTVYSSTNNESYIQIFPAGRLFGSQLIRLEKSANYLYCNEPFQITKNDTLSLLCSSEAGKKSSHFILEVNLNNGSKKLIGRCVNDYQADLQTYCD